MAQNNAWVLTANGAGYRILTQDKKLSPLQEYRNVDWPAARVPAREIASDRPGRTFDSGGQGRHAMQPRTDARQETEMRLAREIADELETAERDGQFDQLIVIAAPRLLGYLRDTLPAPVAQRVTLEIDKDLMSYGADQLTAWLRKEVWEK